MADRKAVVKNADMTEDMQQDAIDISTQALEKFNIEKDIAAFIKKEFDKKYNPTWHCIVGRNFGSYVTHETKHFIYFYLGQVAILLFKSGWAQPKKMWTPESRFELRPLVTGLWRRGNSSAGRHTCALCLKVLASPTLTMMKTSSLWEWGLSTLKGKVLVLIVRELSLLLES